MKESRGCARRDRHTAHEWAIETDEEGMRWFVCLGRR